LKNIERRRERKKNKLNTHKRKDGVIIATKVEVYL
jgi:hypothetical protein